MSIPLLIASAKGGGASPAGKISAPSTAATTTALV